MVCDSVPFHTLMCVSSCVANVCTQGENKEKEGDETATLRADKGNEANHHDSER